MSFLMLLPTDEYSESTKSEEEIKQLMMVEQGSTEKNMIFIMTRGHPLQRPYVYKHFLPYWNDLEPYILSLVSDDTAENQLLATESLVQLLIQKRESLSEQTLDKLFSLAMQCINRQNWNVNQRWGMVLEALLEVRCLPQNLAEMERFVMSLGKSSQPIISRVTAGRLIAIVSPYIPKLKPYMIDTLKGILNYPESEPKLIWLKEIFPKLLKNCKFAVLEVHLQEKLMETVYDKNEDVGACALSLIMGNCELFSREEQENRVIKLFVEAMTSRDEKVVLMISKIMGQVYQKLQSSIRSKESINLAFWEALMELAQSRNSSILNNFLFNLPGILLLSKAYYNIQPISEVYIGLFYQNLASKPQLLSCFHEMIVIFPSKRAQFKQIIYDMFEEALDGEEEGECDEIFKVIDIFLFNFEKVATLFLEQSREDKDSRLEEIMVKYIVGYWGKLEKRRNGSNIHNFHQSLPSYIHLVHFDHIQLRLIPKLFLSLKANLPFSEMVVRSLVLCFHQVTGNLSFVSGYVSKFFIEFGKSVRSFEREIAVRFLTEGFGLFSMEVLRDLKLVDKILHFWSDRNFKVRCVLMTLLPRIRYYLNREETVEYDRVVSEYSNSKDLYIREHMERNREEFLHNDPSVLEEIKSKNLEIREAEKARQICHPPPKRIMGRKDSLAKEHRLSLKDESLKLEPFKVFNKKKLILSQLAIMNRTIDKPSKPSANKKKFKISSAKVARKP